MSKVNPANAHNLLIIGKILALNDQHHRSIDCKSSKASSFLMEIWQCFAFVLK
jgi:hypothetical protein